MQPLIQSLGKTIAIMTQFAHYVLNVQMAKAIAIGGWFSYGYVVFTQFDPEHNSPSVVNKLIIDKFEIYLTVQDI